MLEDNHNHWRPAHPWEAAVLPRPPTGLKPAPPGGEGRKPAWKPAWILAEKGQGQGQGLLRPSHQRGTSHPSLNCGEDTVQSVGGHEGRAQHHDLDGLHLREQPRGDDLGPAVRWH